jgi:hypothetical protein
MKLQSKCEIVIKFAIFAANHQFIKRFLKKFLLKSETQLKKVPEKKSLTLKVMTKSKLWL